MSVLDTFKKHREGRHREERLEEARGEREDERPDRRSLTDDERERVIEEAREELPALDRKVEENVERLRDLSRSS